MKKLFILILTIICAIPSFAQNEGTLSKKEQRILLKEERKRIEALHEEQQRILTKAMIESASFVLEADMLFDRHGHSYNVSSNINFTLVDSLFGVIQIGSNSGMGQNGVGGFTIEGKIHNYEYSFNEKRKIYTIKYDLKSYSGTNAVIMNISETGNGDANVSGSYSGSIRFQGSLVHPSKSRVYKGTSY